MAAVILIQVIQNIAQTFMVIGVHETIQLGYQLTIASDDDPWPILIDALHLPRLNLTVEVCINTIQ